MSVTKFHRRPRTLLALSLCCTAIQAQSVAFDRQTYPDSPVAFMAYTPAVFRSEGRRRQFVTVKNVSDRATAAVLFQQTISDGEKPETVTLERVSIIIRPRETKRLSVNVEDVWNRLQNTVRSGLTIGKPKLSIVAVEFIDGSGWSAPLEK